MSQAVPEFARPLALDELRGGHAVRAVDATPRSARRWRGGST